MADEQKGGVGYLLKQESAATFDIAKQRL